MSRINSVTFCGVETAGSISKLASGPTEPTTIANPSLRDSGAETAGSVAKLGINGLSFRGSGAETAGSISKKDEPVLCPNCSNPVSFRGRDYEEKKGVSALGVVGILAAVTAASVVALAYGHKNDVINKMSDGKMKDLLKKIAPAAEKCHEWCSKAKTMTVECWEKITGKAKK